MWTQFSVENTTDLRNRKPISSLNKMKSIKERKLKSKTRKENYLDFEEDCRKEKIRYNSSLLKVS